MKEVTFNNVKCKTGGSILRKGDARYERYPNIEERKADDHCYLLEAIWIDLNLNKDAIMKLGIDYRGGNDEEDNLSRIYDLVYPWMDACTFLKVELRIVHRTKLSKIEAAEKGVVKLWWYAEWKHIRDTKVDEDEVVERKMLGSAVVQRTKDMIDLIRGRLVVAQDGHDTKGQRV
ncbi:hypothetical protein AgCh_013332 [Apium graveolens]